MEPSLTTEEEEAQKIQEQFDELCIELNVDQKIADIAWRGYEAVRKQCTLEGSQVPWLACSVYVASWLCPPQNFTGQNGQKAAPLAIIDKCELNIIEFFEKLQKWVDMASMSRKFQDQVMRMESCFAVSSAIFKRFESIFSDMFKLVFIKENTPEKTKTSRTRRSVSSQLALNIKQFCWTLFIYIKRSSMGMQDDVVKSYHLLLCCVELMWTNVIAMKRQDLLNEDFTSKINEDSSLIEILCTTYEGRVLDAKQMRVHWFLPRLRTLINEKVLKGDAETQSNLLATTNYEFNLKSMQEHYEKLIMKKGDMDERIFLPRVNKVDPLRSPPTKIRKVESDSDEESADAERELLLRRNVEACLDRVNQYHIPTPLTGRRYLDKELFCPINPFSSAHSASKLQALLSECTLGPTQELRNLLYVYNPQPLILITDVVGKMNDIFLNACAQDVENIDQGEENLNEFANHRRELTEMFFYRILERIVRAEKEKTTLDEMSHVMNQEMFHKALFACCYEVVLYSFNSGKNFPWILKVFNLHAYNFYRVIELVIRPEPELTREMVKHLNRIEERVLEELAWSLDSPLWAALAAHAVPSCEEVALSSPMNKISVLAGSLRQNFASASPVATMGFFHSPGKHQGPAKRRLDFDAEKSSVPVKVSTISIRPSASGSTSDHTITISSIHLPSSSAGGAAQAVRLEKRDGKFTTALAEPRQPPVKIPGSLALFFRKVYYLTSLRLHDLCERVRANDSVKQNAWTVFDFVLTRHTNLMKGRHVDQLLMCSLYIVAKVGKLDVSFHDIMSNYRSQPQAKSRVYRNVLLGSKPNTPIADMDSTSQDASSVSSDEGKPKLRSGSTLPIPAVSSAPPTPTPCEEEYGDLIKFYNCVFVGKIEEFAKKFAASDDASVGGTKRDQSIPVSPLPHVKTQALSPRRRILDGIFVSPLKANSFPMSPARPLRYSFNRSPAKDLRAINNMLRSSDARAGRYVVQHPYSNLPLRRPPVSLDSSQTMPPQQQMPHSFM